MQIKNTNKKYKQKIQIRKMRFGKNCAHGQTYVAVKDREGENV